MEQNWARGKISKRLCPDNTSKLCYSVSFETPAGIRETMWLYKVFQNGLVFVALVAGIFVAGHMLYCRSLRCRNWLLVFTTVVTGFFHMITCLFLLGLSEISGINELPLGGQQDCVDYSSSATVANAVVLTFVAISIIRQNSYSSLKMYCAMCLQIITSSIGLIVSSSYIAGRPVNMQQKVFMTLGKKDTSHIDVFWSVCQTNISEEHYRLLYEYGLIYIPVVVTVLSTWYRTYRRTGDIALVRMKILDSSCQTSDFCKTPCICTKLNTAFAALLFYSFLVLFAGRPAMIIYGHMTSGFFRDILPSLLQTVMFCFISSEYIMWCYRLNFVRPRISSVKSKTVIYV